MISHEIGGKAWRALGYAVVTSGMGSMPPSRGNIEPLGVPILNEGNEDSVDLNPEVWQSGGSEPLQEL